MNVEASILGSCENIDDSEIFRLENRATNKSNQYDLICFMVSRIDSILSLFPIAYRVSFDFSRPQF